MTLARAYDEGRAAALARLKLATLPSARVVPTGAGVRTPVTPSIPPAARQLPAAGGAPAADVVSLPGLPPRPGLLDRAKSSLSGLRPPRLGGTMGLMGLGAAGAMAYGMHRSNANDRERESLVYAPMQGSYMQ